MHRQGRTPSQRFALGAPSRLVPTTQVQTRFARVARHHLIGTFAGRHVGRTTFSCLRNTADPLPMQTYGGSYKCTRNAGRRSTTPPAAHLPGEYRHHGHRQHAHVRHYTMSQSFSTLGTQAAQRDPVSGTQRIPCRRTQTEDHASAQAGQSVDAPSRLQCTFRVSTDNPGTDNARTCDTTETSSVTVKLAKHVDRTQPPRTRNAANPHRHKQTANLTSAHAAQRTEVSLHLQCTCPDSNGKPGTDGIRTCDTMATTYATETQPGRCDTIVPAVHRPGPHRQLGYRH